MKRIAKCVVGVLVAVLSIAAGPEFRQAIEPRAWSFPRDHGRHDEFKIEWWYFTGNCHDARGRAFGYELSFFRSAFAPGPATRPSRWGMNDVYFAHAAITDVNGKRFIYKEKLERARPGLAWAADQGLDVSLLDWSCQADESGTIYLKAADGGLGIDLACTDGRGPFLQGPGGVNAKGTRAGQASYYYSMTRLKTAGTLNVDGHACHVDGLSWMDHEFASDSLGSDQIGWDWMGLQLNDGSDLMVYRMRKAGNATDYLSGTRVTPDGQPHYLAASDITLAGSLPWTSETSHAIYPQLWHLSVDGRPLVVRSKMAGQELVTKSSADVTYFEGAVTVEDEHGHPAGEGYLEMTGYNKSIVATK